MRAEPHIHSRKLLLKPLVVGSQSSIFKIAARAVIVVSGHQQPAGTVRNQLGIEIHMLQRIGFHHLGLAGFRVEQAERQKIDAFSVIGFHPDPFPVGLEP